MKSKKQRPDRFITFIYFCLAIFALEAAIYFSRSLFSPSLIFAQTQLEVTSSALLASPTLTPHSVSPKLPILIYHYVEYVTDEKDTIRQSLNINPRTFENQINTLKDSAYTFVTPSDIQKIERGELSIEKPVIISFDDGYRDFYTDVFPILKKHQVKAVAYIVPGFLDKLNYMYWNQVKEISSSGLVEIGAHTINHRSLNNLTNDAAFREINDSKIILELALGEKITTFAYPYGHFNDQTPDLVKSAGFTSALTTDEGTNENLDDKFLLKRIHPGGRTSQDLIKTLN